MDEAMFYRQCDSPISVNYGIVPHLLSKRRWPSSLCPFSRFQAKGRFWVERNKQQRASRRLLRRCAAHCSNRAPQDRLLPLELGEEGRDDEGQCAELLIACSAEVL